MDDAQWQSAYELNLLSTIRLVREVLPHMRKAGGGVIINLQSTSVKVPLDNLIVFLASERAPYVTGVTVQVDGGLVRSML